MSNLHQNQTVKLVNPANDAERSARYILKELNGDRAQIELVCGLPIRPVETVSVADIEPAPISELERVYDLAKSHWQECRYQVELTKAETGYSELYTRAVAIANAAYDQMYLLARMVGREADLVEFANGKYVSK